MVEYLPVGKLPVDLLRKLIGEILIEDSSVIVGPGVGMDCTVIDAGPKYMVLKTDPITFTATNIGWYAVNICANDIATTGATPCWFMATILLPEFQTTTELIEQIQSQIIHSCREINVTFLGGHTEITLGIERPIVVGIMIGEVEKKQLISPRDTKPGDRILLTKGIPIEATAILAQEFSSRLSAFLSEGELSEGKNFTQKPGISVLKDAQIAISSGTVHAMHDPTEGGLAAALWELAEASQLSIEVDIDNIPVYEISRKICELLNIDPLAAISSGSLLIVVPVEEVINIQKGLKNSGIAVTIIGRIFESISGYQPGDPIVVYKKNASYIKLFRPDRDEIGKLFA